MCLGPFTRISGKSGSVLLSLISSSLRSKFNGSFFIDVGDDDLLSIIGDLLRSNPYLKIVRNL